VKRAELRIGGKIADRLIEWMLVALVTVVISLQFVTVAGFLIEYLQPVSLLSLTCLLLIAAWSFSILIKG